MIVGLKVVFLFKIEDLKIYDDSQLIIYHVNDIYNIKYEKIHPYRVVVVQLLHQFDRYTITNIPRKNNRYVDTMESATLLAQIEIEDDHIILKIKNLTNPYYMDSDSDKSYVVFLNMKLIHYIIMIFINI